jgi:hypothetical protein
MNCRLRIGVVAPRRRLKPLFILEPYRSGEPLRHPKSDLFSADLRYGIVRYGTIQGTQNACA